MAEHHNKVLRSPINTSISKNLYSFPKSQRFQPSRQSPCKRSYYNIKKGALDSRTTSFGYDSKVDLINHEEVPAPGSYNHKDYFMNNRMKRSGWGTFSLGRRQTFSRELGRNSPGPGSYERVNKNYTHLSFSFSMSTKYKNPLEKIELGQGPGAYSSPPTINSKGNYFNSKYRGSLCGKIGKASRFDDDSPLSPGPGKYNDNLSMNKTGVYFNSRFPTNYVKSFQGTAHLPINDPSETPGPGTYYQFSEFAARRKVPSF